jgi:hypothetical protein
MYAVDIIFYNKDRQCRGAGAARSGFILGKPGAGGAPALADTFYFIIFTLQLLRCINKRKLNSF